MGLLEVVTKGVSSGLALAGEKYYDRQERKAALASQERSVSPAGDHASIHELVNPLEPGAETSNDERIWMFDEATGPPPPKYEETEKNSRPVTDRTVSNLVHDVAVMREYESLSQFETPIRLPHPIVIPQRRPGSKARGFARAYPPDLEAFGINQETFMQFFQSFEDASQASPWLRTLQLSAGVIGLVPGHITMAVSLSLQIAAGTAIEFQSRYRANAFLDQMNKDVFMPLGLYCMVLMCKDGPGSTQNPEFGIETVNLNTAKQITQWGMPKQHEDDELDVSRSKKVLRPIRLASGKTKVSEMPLEIAPLIYPGLDDMVNRPHINRDESFKDRMLRHKQFYADYFDRRARAEYQGNNPDSALTKASSDMPEFRTRFADPNHPVNNGHLVSLVTGGKVVAQPRGRRQRLREVGEDGKLKPAVKQERGARGPIGLVSQGVKKVFTPNILYLTIVNLPSEAELAEARSMLGMEQNGIKDMLQEMHAARDPMAGRNERRGF